MSVDVPLGPLLEPAFHVGSVPTTWAELLGFGTGAVNVWLVVRQNILNWPIGIANVILLGLVFLDGGLYADSGLQVFYVGLQLYGWWMLLYCVDGRDNLPVRRTRPVEWAALVTAGAAVMSPLWGSGCRGGVCGCTAAPAATTCRSGGRAAAGGQASSRRARPPPRSCPRRSPPGPPPPWRSGPPSPPRSRSWPYTTSP